MLHRFHRDSMNWAGKQKLAATAYRCAYCGNNVSSDSGFKIGAYNDGSGEQFGGIFICPHCKCPTFVVNGHQMPESAFGSAVSNVPEQLNDLYDEARQCTSASCYTASVLVSRKILMHIAVQQGAKEGQTFLAYVNHLADAGYVPPNGKLWVDHIRKKGNEATHEIQLMDREHAAELIIFIEMLLKFIYEFPSMIPTEPSSAQ